MNHQAAFYEPLLAFRGLSQGLKQVVPARRGKADAVFLGDLAVQAASFQVLHRVATRGADAQLLLKVVAGLFQKAIEGLLDLRLRTLGAGLRLPRTFRT